MKKFFAGFLILAAMIPVAFMAGCGTSSSPTSSNPTSTPTANATPIATLGPAGPALGSALSSNFAVLSEGAITDSGETIDGNLGCAGAYTPSSPTATFVGASSANPYTSGSVLTAAITSIFSTGPGAATGAYNVTLAQYPTPTVETYTGTSLSLSPGVYSVSTMAASYNITLENSGGNPNNVYIFFVNTFSSGAGSSITLHNVKAANVYWVATGTVNLGASSIFAGNLMASSAVNFGVNVQYEGRIFAWGAVNFTGTSSTGGVDTIINP